MRNWRTTLAGVLVAAAAILTSVAREVDGDPNTVADWGTTVALVVAAAGLIFSKDAAEK
ncbi:MAG: hypothetical protein KatS3mg038_3856 [Candidatus Kapaibacterium sp.]|nr:MAG: hypothetical protein KatS3mg038_0741 [Candidatus Kapabacteria bacterium]GIV50897.1 MAG: hypothetical protein KatS3mg038_1418 [Candidatus Kapabacteria bacterium]GIV51157.1 MAG: hypothetical protein KatS3mg038_1678 [Candidatus Kapabacteria bacterium]GIV52547.1 MAG: hypothetical protein KatS3mg038_3068 [Candidatus Kapabacteria bacterium]GIV52769.1 MAG: hypothetical protein KatS3mg038_3290 [Candidatus Kapabacteria bacterium]